MDMMISDIISPLTTNTIEGLQASLEKASKQLIQLKVNNNRSTIISVRWERERAKVSLHRMFLSAPNSVLQGIADYIHGKNKTLSRAVRQFMDDHLKNYDYSHKLNTQHLMTQGRVYDIQESFDRINAQYFDNQVDLKITWFGTHQQRNRSRITFGLYSDALKLVKIHRVLDDLTTPLYVLDFVVYHEVLHSICPAYLGEGGRQCIHSKEFKEKERQYCQYHEAIEWIKDRRNTLFLRSA